MDGSRIFIIVLSQTLSKHFNALIKVHSGVFVVNVRDEEGYGVEDGVAKDLLDERIFFFKLFVSQLAEYLGLLYYYVDLKLNLIIVGL